MTCVESRSMGGAGGGEKGEGGGDQLQIESHGGGGGGWGVRHVQAVLLFLGMMAAYSVRACMGVALVAMTTAPATPALPDLAPAGMLFAPPYPVFDWDKQTKDLVLSSFFWGYMSLQIPAGALVLRVGPKRLLVAALAVNAVAFLLFPWIVYYGGVASAGVARVAMGGAQACVVPATHTALARWAPPSERGRLAGAVYGAQALGTVVALPLTSWVCGGAGGWPALFRVLGAALAAAALLLAVAFYDQPRDHPALSAAEQDYIEGPDAAPTPSTQESTSVPWRDILSSPGMWAIVAGHASSTWGQIFLFSEVPAYLSDIMQVDIRNNGMLTALPFLAMWAASFAVNAAADALINSRRVTTTTARKIFNSLGALPAALGLVVLCHVPHNIYIVETVLVLICIFKICMHMGFQVNHIDISPRYAGTMMSVSNFVANGCGSFAPLLAGLVVTDPKSAAHWHRMFYVTAAVYSCGNALYVWLGSAQRAHWDMAPRYSAVPRAEPRTEPHTEPRSEPRAEPQAETATDHTHKRTDRDDVAA